MNIPADLIDGDSCLFRTAGIVGDLVSWREDDNQGIDHIAKFVHGKLFSSLTKQGICWYDFTTAGLVCVRRPPSWDVAKFDAWWPSVLGAPYGWGDIAAAAGVNDQPHFFVPSAAVIHASGSDCSDTCAMADEVAGCPQFDPQFDKRRITPFHFTLSVASKEVWPTLAPPS